ncbi:MAG: hypothetical protein ACRDU4_17715 [Mycobacterium sp.]
MSLADTQHLPQGRSQAGDRHLKFHDARGNLPGQQRGGRRIAETMRDVADEPTLDAGRQTLLIVPTNQDVVSLNV